MSRKKSFEPESAEEGGGVSFVAQQGGEASGAVVEPVETKPDAGALLRENIALKVAIIEHKNMAWRTHGSYRAVDLKLYSVLDSICR